MTSNDGILCREIIGHGAYVCVRVPGDVARRKASALPVPALAERLGLRNEYEPAEAPPRESIAFLRRAGSTPGDIADDGVLQADAVVHVASRTAAPVDDFCAELLRLLGGGVTARVLAAWSGPRTTRARPCTTSPTRTRWSSNRDRPCPTPFSCR